MKAPRFLNEWMNELLVKINKKDKTTSQVCAFMSSLMQAPWEKLESVSLDWKEYTEEHPGNFNTIEKHTVIKPKITVNFK